MDMIITRNVLYGELIECEDCSRMIEILETETECDGCGHLIWCGDLTLEPRCDPYNTAIPRDTKKIDSEIDANRALVDEARKLAAKKITDRVINTFLSITESHTRKS